MLCCTGHGGNTGSQSVTTVIRALALKQISCKDMLRVVLKEAGAGCMMGEHQAGRQCMTSYHTNRRNSQGLSRQAGGQGSGGAAGQAGRQTGRRAGR